MLRRPKQRAAEIMLWCIMALTMISALIIVARVWPYDDVRFGSPVSVVVNPVVNQGGPVTLKNSSFCNDNQDTLIERWADVLDDNDNVIASYELFSIQFFNRGNGLYCAAPTSNTLTLPNYVTGPNGENGRFSIRQVISYHPNPVRTVTVTVTSTPFRVISTKENGVCPTLTLYREPTPC